MLGTVVHNMLFKTVALARISSTRRLIPPRRRLRIQVSHTTGPSCSPADTPEELAVSAETYAARP